MERMNSDVNNLLRKYLNGTITEPEGEELFAWLREHAPEEQEGMEALLKETYDSSFTEGTIISTDASERILAKLNGSLDAAETPTASVVPIRRSWLRYAAAAAVLLVLAGGAWWITNSKQPVETQPLAKTEVKKEKEAVLLTLPTGEQVPLDYRQGSVVKKDDFNVINDSGLLSYLGKTAVVEYHTLSTPAGKQYELKLPDGTEVWLNAKSSVTFPTAFTGSERKVYITGEAYFVVKGNSKQPFLVDVNKKAMIEVLGTEFNVNAYTNEPEVQATLLNGKIRVKKDAQAVELAPGDQARVDDTKLELKKNVDTDLYVAWKQGVFRFDNASAAAVLRQLARWYDVDVVYEGAVPVVKFSGEINRESSLEVAIDVLNKMGLHTRAEAGKIIVAP
ncbi:MAG: FecR family protein [Pseudobacter sp.]|uniref:FecR family protein n=1 Tax=Pseudobacter sp. TaxID=2045420 RepID=UPI003F7DD227